VKVAVAVVPPSMREPLDIVVAPETASADAEFAVVSVAPVTVRTPTVVLPAKVAVQVPPPVRVPEMVVTLVMVLAPLPERVRLW